MPTRGQRRRAGALALLVALAAAPALAAAAPAAAAAGEAASRRSLLFQRESRARAAGRGRRPAGRTRAVDNTHRPPSHTLKTSGGRCREAHAERLQTRRLTSPSSSPPPRRRPVGESLADAGDYIQNNILTTDGVEQIINGLVQSAPQIGFDVLQEFGGGGFVSSQRRVSVPVRRLTLPVPPPRRTSSAAAAAGASTALRPRALRVQ